MSCGPSSSRSPSCAARGACPRSCAPSTTPARWPTPSTSWADQRARAPRSRCSRPSTSTSGCSWCSTWATRGAGRARDGRADPQRRHRGHGQGSSASSCCASSWPPSARSSARATTTRVDEYRAKLADARRCPRRCATRSSREIDRLERTSEQSPEHGWIRTWLDRVLELPWGERSDDHLDLDRGPRRARRRPHRPRRREGPHRRVPRPCASCAPSAASNDGGRRPARRRRDPRARRPSRRRQDVARRVGRPRAGPQVRARRPRRRARRGRDPRPPAHLRRRAARAASSAPSPRPAR